MGLTLELARLQRTSVPWLDKVEESFVSGFILRTVELEFQQDPSIFSCLDKIKLDDSNVLLRLSVEGPSWESITYFCKLAYLSQSFYRCISADQWVWTIMKPQNPGFEIRSNVVPRHAYYLRLQGANASCAPDCTGGFVPGITSARSVAPCASCALAERLIDRTHTSVPCRGGFWELAGVAPVRDHDSLGQGSQGEVKKVLWRKGVFARKRLSLESAHERNEFLTREVDVALSVTHPNIVHCFGCSRLETDRYCDLFMELLDGDLERLLEDGGRTEEPVLSFRDVLDVLLQITEAMRHLHERNFVHGDLKPANIFVSKLAMPHNDAQFHLVKVGDFGTTQRVGSAFDFGIGTTNYIAPEVLQCRMSEGWRSYVRTRRTPSPSPPPPPPEHPQKIDVYSFGVVAYQVFAGEPEVYVGVKNIAREVIAGRRPDFDLDGGSLDGDRSSLLPLIQSCWTQDPQERPSFSQICAELKGRLVEYDHRLRSEIAKRMFQRIDQLGDCTALQQRVQGIMLSDGLRG